MAVKRDCLNRGYRGGETVEQGGYYLKIGKVGQTSNSKIVQNRWQAPMPMPALIFDQAR